MWHYTFTIQLGADETESSFQYFGPQLASVFDADHTGKSLEEAFQDDILLQNTIGFYPKTVETRSPVSESSSFFSEGKEVKYRSLIVPLSSDGTIIDFVLGTTNYKIF